MNSVIISPLPSVSSELDTSCDLQLNKELFLSWSLKILLLSELLQNCKYQKIFISLYNLNECCSCSDCLIGCMVALVKCWHGLMGITFKLVNQVHLIRL